MRIAATALCLALLPGCSWLFVDKAPVGHERMRVFDCTTSRAAPIIDTVVASVYGISGIASIGLASSSGGDRYGDGELRAISILAPLGIAVATGFSAAYGYSTTAECEDAKTAWAQRELTRPRIDPGACASDADCRGDRICERGACILPDELPADPTVPAEASGQPPLGPGDPTVPAPPLPDASGAPAPTNPAPIPTPSPGVPPSSAPPAAEPAPAPTSPAP